MNNPQNSLSMITEAGALHVQIPAIEVTWFEFLQFSRATNSLYGGWNNKSYWWNRGLMQLTSPDADFPRQWTINSLMETRKPLLRPRKGKFMFDRLTSENRLNLAASLSAATDPLENGTENELSYDLCKGVPGILKKIEGVEILGYEIPLGADSEGQLKVDIFGISSSKDALEIIELKKAQNTSDSPLFALTETICYALQALRCKEALLTDDKLKSHQDGIAPLFRTQETG